ncbi:AAA family ATPase [Ralstonia sp. CHL-2022]|uniref:AAA family ATPase n=1 Tax=Ralstonia mojiangensis TaxID=2953895 RepID=A0ABT2LF23_9RALS|nr:AAA family ATPase [Ralstonia mojiangensis]MCT7313822.1 AAA family ATPase [Ralstonia mojiangensis]
MGREQFYVITGASGAGKSTLLKALAERGYSVMPEAALSIVREQEECGGTLLPGTDLQAFMNEVVARNIHAHEAAKSLRRPVFFDRGIPECIGHMALLNLDISPAYIEESRARRYANTVFVAEPWPEIYVCDQWRRAPFARAARSFEPTVLPYVKQGYTTCVLPKVPVEQRVAFILDQVRRPEP